MNNTDRDQIIKYANKGMSLIQLEIKFRPITYTQIKEICDEYYYQQKQNEPRTKRGKGLKRLSEKGAGKGTIQFKNSKKSTGYRKAGKPKIALAGIIT